MTETRSETIIRRHYHLWTITSISKDTRLWTRLDGAYWSRQTARYHQMKSKVPNHLELCELADCAPNS